MTALPLDDILAQHVATVGKVGSGKTYAAKGMVEHLLERGRRVCVIDPTGVWWGLRSSADGSAPGFPVVVFGGERADVPLLETSAEPLAGIVAERNLPCVLDLSEMMTGERQRFVTDFARALHAKNRQPLNLVIDEADEFAPQNPLPESRRMLHEIDRIVRRGRVRGFRVMLITQRPAVLHKNVLTQANTLIAMRLTAPQDRKAIEEWVKGQADAEQARDVLSSLARMQRGEGWVWSPEHGVLERTLFPTIRTFDSSRTPEDGDAAAEPLSFAPVDVAELRGLLEAPAEEEPVPKRDDGEVHRLRARVKELEAENAELDAALGRAVETMSTIETAAADYLSGRAAKTLPSPAAPSPRQEAAAAAPPDGAQHAAARAILGVLASHHPMWMSWQQAATLAGLKARGGHFNAGRKELRDGALVAEQNGLVQASETGLRQAGVSSTAPTSPADLLELWCAKLPSPAPEMLRYLVAQRGRVVTRDELAKALGKQPRGGHWNSGLASLRNNGLIESDAAGLWPSNLFLDGPIGEARSARG